MLLVQVVKEERGNKGAALTTYLIARRPLLRADAEHVARRRHQPEDLERRRPQAPEADHGRSQPAAEDGLHRPHRRPSRTKTEIKRDFDYLARLWDEIREKTLKQLGAAL